MLFTIPVSAICNGCLTCSTTIWRVVDDVGQEVVLRDYIFANLTTATALRNEDILAICIAYDATKVLWSVLAYWAKSTVSDCTVVAARCYGRFAHKVSYDTAHTCMNRTCIDTCEVRSRYAIRDVRINGDTYDTCTYGVTQVGLDDVTNLVLATLDSSVCCEAYNTCNSTTVSIYISCVCTVLDSDRARR